MTKTSQNPQRELLLHYTFLCHETGNFIVFKVTAIEKTNTKARVKEKKNRFLNQNSNLRASNGTCICFYVKPVHFYKKLIFRDSLKHERLLT